MNSFEAYIKDKEVSLEALPEHSVRRYKLAYIKECIEKEHPGDIQFAFFLFDKGVENLKWIDHAIGRHIRGHWQTSTDDFPNEIIVINEHSLPNFKKDMEGLAEHLLQNPPRTWDARFLKISRFNW